MTKSRDLTQVASVFDATLFQIWDGTQNRTVSGATLKKYIQPAIFDGNALVDGRVVSDILIMVREDGSDKVIGAVGSQFNLGAHDLDELRNVESPMKPGMFLITSADGKSIGYSPADPQGDSLAIEDNAVDQGKAQVLDFQTGVSAVVTGNVANINVIPLGYKDLSELSASDNPETMDTGIARVIAKFVGAPDLPIGAKYDGFIQKQNGIFNDKYKGLIYYSGYGTYIKECNDGTWSDWYTDVTTNTAQDIVAEKTFKELLTIDKKLRANSDIQIAAFTNLFFDHQTSGALGSKDYFRISSYDDHLFFSTEYNNVSTKVFYISYDGFAKFKRHLYLEDGARIIYGVGSSNNYTRADTGEEKKWWLGAESNYWSVQTKVNNAWVNSFWIDENGKCHFDNNPDLNHIVTTNTTQTISANKTFANPVAFGQTTDFDQNASFNYHVDLKSYMRVFSGQNIGWDRTHDNYPNYFRMFVTAGNNLYPKGGWHLTVEDPWRPDRNQNAIYVESNGRVHLVNSFFYDVFKDQNRYIQPVTYKDCHKHCGNSDPHTFDTEIWPGAHIDKIQIRVDEPFCDEGYISVGTKDDPVYFAKVEGSRLMQKGVVEIPIAMTAKENISPVINIHGEHDCGKAEVYIVSH